MTIKLMAMSKSRYNGGVQAKRLYGSSTITEFYVFRAEDEYIPRRWVIIEAGGRTPGERVATAKSKAEPILRELLAKEGIII